MRAALLLLLGVVLAACRTDAVGLDIVDSYPHDPQAYTQGLLLSGNTLFESTGLHGRSSVRKVALGTGAVMQQRPLAQQYFGEGLALVGDRLIQLTWQQGTAFVYDTTRLEVQQTFSYEGEGWGLCHDGTALYMSDGSSTLQRRDPVTFVLRDSLRVTLDGAPLTAINELECVGEHIYANVYMTNWVVQIDKQSGVVVEEFDLAGLLPESGRPATHDAVLNGIAYDPATGTFLVTGKLWAKLFRVRLGTS